MINALLTGILNIVIKFIELILSPIDNLISSAIPNLSTAFSKVGDFFTWLSGIIPWSVSWLGLDREIIALFVTYTTIELTLPFLIHSFKFVIKWYDKLKP